MTNQIRPDVGTLLEARSVEWLKRRFPSAKHYARAANIKPETAKKRLASDDLDRRGLRLSELGRAVAGEWRDFFNEVWRPTFETPDENLEAMIHELQAELASRRAARSSVFSAASPVDRKPD